MSCWAQLQKDTPVERADQFRTKEKERLYARNVSGAGAMVTAQRSAEDTFRDRVSKSLQMGQYRIQESARNRDEAFKASMKMLTEETVAEEDESPMVPRRMPHPDNAIMDCWQLDDSDSEGGKLFVPPEGNPFRVVVADFFIPPILPHNHACTTEQKGRMEFADGRGSSMSICERIYRDSNNSVQQLLVMCIGLINSDGENDRFIANFEEDVLYKEYLEKVHMPKVPQLKAEMQRRAKEQGIKRLRKNSVLKPEAISWLKENPVKDPSSIDFLLKTEESLYKAMMELAVEAEASEQEKLATSNWNGPKPWLRLYMCATDDRAIEALKVKNDCMDRDELSARNHRDRPETHDEVVARLYNDDTFVPSTEALPDLHITFAEEIDLPFTSMPGGMINAEVVKTKMSDARAKLLQVGSSLFAMFALLYSSRTDCTRFALLARAKLTLDRLRDVSS